MSSSRKKKALSTILIVILVLVVVIVIAGAIFFVILSSPGNQRTQTYSYSDFSNLDVGSAFHVNVTQSDTFSVTVTAGERIFDRISVTKTGDTLKIEVNPGIFFGTLNARADITMPTLNSITLSGATSGTLEGLTTQNTFTADISGASSLEAANLQTGDLNIMLEGASRFVAEGNGNNLDATVSGASNMDLENFQVNDADVTISGASHAVVSPTGTLDVDASGASSLQYTGNPNLGDINTSGASTVNRKD